MPYNRFYAITILTRMDDDISIEISSPDSINETEFREVITLLKSVLSAEQKFSVLNPKRPAIVINEKNLLAPAVKQNFNAAMLNLLNRGMLQIANINAVNSKLDEIVEKHQPKLGLEETKIKMEL